MSDANDYLWGDLVSFQLRDDLASGTVDKVKGEFLRLRGGYWIHEDQIV